MTHLRLANAHDFAALVCLSFLLLSACGGGHDDMEDNFVSKGASDESRDRVYYPRSDIAPEDNHKDCGLCKSIAIYGMGSECCI